MFPTQLQEYIYLDKYSRFDYEKGRREYWPETVQRTVKHLKSLVGDNETTIDWDELESAIFNLDVMPSMRNLAMAGAAAERSSIVSYNCAYAPVQDLLSFKEAVIILMSGSGLGYSVESNYINKLPKVKQQSGRIELYVVPDTSDGWSVAVYKGVTAWMNGYDMTFDYSNIRKAGTPLKIKGGRASGGEHLKKGIDRIRDVILNRQLKNLRSIDVHDIMCYIAEAIVSGGVRRCLPEGTRVHTNRGSLQIEDVKIGDLAMTDKGYKEVTGWLNQGKQKTIKLTTESGTTFRCTPDHRIAILSDVWGGYEFKEAQYISKDDRILFITNEIHGENKSLLLLPNKREADNSGSVIKQPSLTVETAWFLGKFLADGYVQVTSIENGKKGNCTLSVASHEGEHEQNIRVRNWMEDHGLNVHDHSSPSEKCVKLRSGNRQMARWMYQYKQPNTEISIPNEIWTATGGIRAAFLAGIIDGDGSLKGRPVNIVSTVYESFARDVARLLSTLGIISEVKLARVAKGNWQELWKVTIKDAHALAKAELLLGKYTAKQWPSRIGKQSGYTIPNNMVKRDIKTKVWRKKWSGKGDMNSATLTEMTNSLQYVPVKIINIESDKNEHTYDIEVKDGNVFVTDGYLVHNSAMIALFDMDDKLMRGCKSGAAIEGNEQRWFANNSVVVTERLSKEAITALMEEMAEDGSGEPGIFSRYAANRTKPARRESREFGTNPCVVGDTWIAVADGRGRVKMSELAKAGKDIDVLTVKGAKLVTRKMRNPRLTCVDSPIIKVSFADGTFIRVTPNHEFVLRGGERKKAISLSVNDALRSMKTYSYKKKGLPKTKKVTYDEKPSYRMLQFGRYRKSEHRFIMQNKLGHEIKGLDHHVHHKNFDGRDNSIDNLEYLSAKDHAALHRDRMLGENNPIHNMTEDWRRALSKATTGLKNGKTKTITNEELERAIGEFIIQTGYIPTVREYKIAAKEKNWPITFSAYRQEYFGGKTTVALHDIAISLGITMSARLVDLQKRTDFKVLIEHGEAFVIRSCEKCNNEFQIRFNRREQSYCGQKCSTKAVWEKSKIMKNLQVESYNDLTMILARNPSESEWIAHCQLHNIGAGENSFQLLESEATATNHRVIAVESDGYEDVYTGTVDETHTFFAVGQAAVDSKERLDMRYVLNVNCGEIFLRPYEFCNLTSVVCRQTDTYRELLRKVRIATSIGTIQSMATNFVGLRPEWEKNGKEERLLGVDLNGIMDCGLVRGKDTLKSMKDYAVLVNKTLAMELGINQSASITCVKPSGNSSTMLDTSPGLHTRWSDYYIRRVQTDNTSPLKDLLLDAGAPVERRIASDSTWVVSFPVKAPNKAITRHDLNAIQQCEMWKMLKTGYTEHNPSVTITYNDSEIADLIDWVYENQDLLGGMAFLPSFDAVYEQMPYEEITKAEYEKAVANFPTIDWKQLERYEAGIDSTSVATTFACTSDKCVVY